MHRPVLGIVLAAMFSVAALHEAQAAPPPPPPVYVDALAKLVIATPTQENFSAFTKAFADDLRVIVNGKETASSRDAWIPSQVRTLGKIDRRVVLFSEGYSDLMIVDQYDDLSDVIGKPNIIYDSRFKTRVTRYTVGLDHLIHMIRSEEAPGFWRVACKPNLSAGAFPTAN
jgi:hypothetical protein